MFNADFYPSPAAVIEEMINGEHIEGAVILEPSAGKGNIVDYLLNSGAETVLACENNADLKKILHTKCKVIADDFLTLTSDQISHIDLIVMNPPFSSADKHILHAFSIAPDGCRIIALCNSSTIENTYTESRKQLFNIVENYGSNQNLGECFTDAERETRVKVALLKIQKPGEKQANEFEGFFMEEEHEKNGEYSGIMPYNVVRDLVNRYVGALKIYDKQLQAGEQMNSLLSGFYGESLAFTCTENGAPKLKNEFKKDLQKAGWGFIFNKMNLQKYATKGLRDDINKFVEQQQKIPFTMRNIYRMLDVVIGTAPQRMDKALIEVFDKVTSHHSENRHNVKGWKTNSHFLVGKKFILPNIISPAKEYGYTSGTYSYLKDNHGVMQDFEKALCFITGSDYDNINDYENKSRTREQKTINVSIDRNTYGEWYTSHFFRYKAYKNGNMHFEFMNEKVWEDFNRKISVLKGFPLFEGKEQTAYQNRQTGRQQPKTTATKNSSSSVLFEM